MLEQYAAMLHHIITGEIRVDHECEYQSSFMENPQKRPDIEGKEGKTLPEQRDPDARGAEIGRIMEECIMQAIREGNVNFDLGQVTSKEGHQTSVSCIEPDHFEKGEVNRDEKNTVIVFVALCARAAMDGGLSPEWQRKCRSRISARWNRSSHPRILSH